MPCEENDHRLVLELADFMCANDFFEGAYSMFLFVAVDKPFHGRKMISRKGRNDLDLLRSVSVEISIYKDSGSQLVKKNNLKGLVPIEETKISMVLCPVCEKPSAAECFLLGHVPDGGRHLCRGRRRRRGASASADGADECRAAQ